MEKNEEMAKEELIEEMENKTEDELNNCHEEESHKQSTEENLEDQLKEKDTEIEELTNRFLRLQADFMNYKNRVVKDKENTLIYATEDLLNQLLPILDNFERALDSVEEEDGFYQGVKMIYEQFVKVLNDNGLKEIQCVGECFDPNLHHAVLMEEAEDTEEGTILEVFQKGYILNDKVIRPSMVKVAK
jgi:molecular chaperone GrpE